MKKYFISILLFLGCMMPVISQHGKVYDNLSMPSEILDSERKYAIYLPPDYTLSERHYPVLYLLHGSGDDQSGWIQFGEVRRIADEAIHSGKSTPMIIVMPDANSGRRGYSNSIDGEWRYEDFFFDEFMPYIEQKYRIRTEKRYRAVAGLSMGGGGAFLYALQRPDLFSAACPLSASARVYSLEELKKSLGKSARQLEDKQIETYYMEHNIHQLVENSSVEALKSVRWYIDCGDDDFLYEGNSMLHIALRNKGIPHEYRVRDGGHNWSYWRSSLPEVLDFVSMGFHQY